MVAHLRVLDFAGATPSVAHLRILDFVGAVAPRAHLRILDFVGDVVITLAANAGADVTVPALSTVRLNGSASSGRPDRFHWVQTGGTGPIVALQPSADAMIVSFTAPALPFGCTLEFTLYVAEESGEFVASPDVVTVTVVGHPVFVKFGGQLRALSLDAMPRLLGLDAA